MQRVWSSASNAQSDTPEDRMMWDFGSEFWETTDYEKITHYKVLSRESVVGGIIEVVEELPESPIPAEAIPKKISGWNIKVVELTPYKIQSRAAVKDLPQQHVASSSSPVREARPQARSREARPQARPPQNHTKAMVKPKLAQNVKVSPLPAEDIDTSEREANKRDLWTSLSQWIPPSALYQASLHEEILELLEQSQPVKRQKPKPKQKQKPAQIQRPLSL